MLNPFRKSQPHGPSAALANALGRGALPTGVQPTTLAVVDQAGSYSGRKVSYFRVFDPAVIAERGVRVRDFRDLDAHPDLVLGSGHVESDGAVVLAKTDRPDLPATSVRSTADRSVHADDEQFVFHAATPHEDPATGS